MADVYLAQDTTLKRDVAFKVMLDALAIDPQYVQRFQREARTVARLDHPNIIQVYSTGQTPFGQPYIAMQYISGGSLRDRLEQLAERGKLLTTEQTLNLARQLALALSVAHRAGVIHRDLKPSNILIRPDGTPVLVDLGIAAVSSGGPKLTQTGGFVGTPAYMSPEQARSRPLDGRSDIYSFGIILYELLAGRRPFEAENLTTILYKQVNEDPVPLQQLRPDTSRQTQAIIATCLQKSRDDRYQSAADLIPAIDAALQAEGNSTYDPQMTQVLTHLSDSALISRKQIVPPEVEAEPELKRKRPPVWVMVSAGVFLLAAAFLLFSQRGDEPADDPTNVPEIAVVETAPATGSTELSSSGQAVPTTATSATMAPTEPPTAVPTPEPSATATEPPAPTQTAQPTTPLPTETATVIPDNVFQPIPLQAVANGTIDFSAPPVGEVTLGGVPFQLSTSIFKSQASASPFTAAPVRLPLAANVAQAQQLHLLLTLGNGFTQFANQVVGRVEIVCDDTLIVLAQLQAGVHVREWHNGQGVITTASLARSVWSEPITDDVRGTIDLLSLELPQICQDGRLTSIELIDSSTETVGSLDPALNLVGISVEYRP